ncbi:nuclear transport factor 2 family protein [Pleurocapsales cyanobacterium LEGE 06147]|nr:nuclear transport factor 2 family protein [Pleurocapsales cyanobacterium LEGE 06147]
MTTKEIVNKYYDYVNKGDWNNWLTLFDDNIVIDEQLAGHLEGIKILGDAVGGLEKGYSKFLMHPQRTLINRSHAFVIWNFEGANASGVPIEAKGVNYFRVENDKITYMSNFHDTRPFDPFLNQKLD